MYSIRVLTAIAAVCQAYSIPFSSNGMEMAENHGTGMSMADGQTVLDISVHISNNQHQQYQDDMHNNGFFDTNAVKAQYARGVIAATHILPANGYFNVHVGGNNEAYASLLNKTWTPAKGSWVGLGGKFNRSLSVYNFLGDMYIAGVTVNRNLVLKKYYDNGQLYPKYKNWIILDEDVVAGTTALASHENKTVSIVARKTDGSLIHTTYNPGTDEISSYSIPNQKFASSPALLVRPGNKLQAFATDSNGQMFFAEWKGSGSWSSWTGLGGNFTGDPATTWLGPLGDIWSVGKDGAVYARYYSSAGCFSATWLRIEGWNALNTGSVHYWGPNNDNAEFFVQTTSDVKLIRRVGDTLYNQESIGGVIQAAPSAFAFQWGNKKWGALWAVGMDNAIYRRERTESAWTSGWEKIGGQAQTN